jgi:hypothetical protein
LQRFVVGLKPYANPTKQRQGLFFRKATTRTFSAAHKSRKEPIGLTARLKLKPFQDKQLSAASEAALSGQPLLQNPLEIEAGGS